jgi:hypothetical protein
MDLVGGWFIIDCGQKQRQIGGGDIGAKQSGGGRIAMGWVACAGSQPRDRQKEAGPPKLGRNFSPNLWPDTTRQALLLLLPPPLRAPPPPVSLWHPSLGALLVILVSSSNLLHFWTFAAQLVPTLTLLSWSTSSEFPVVSFLLLLLPRSSPYSRTPPLLLLEHKAIGSQ